VPVNAKFAAALSGRHVKFFFEAGDKVAQGRKAQRLGYVLFLHGAGFQEVPGFRKAALHDKA
jgi:hypothetical protein